MQQCSDEKCCSQEKVCHENAEACSKEEWFLELADCAWTEVLKDKIKEYILAKQNERMTELAKIIAEANNQRWKHKLEGKHACTDFKEKLMRFFSKK